MIQLVSAIDALAGNVLGQAEAVTSTKIESVWDFVIKGGPVMIPIAIASLVALAVFVERLFVLRRSQVVPPDVLPALKGLLPSNRTDRAAALEYCTKNGSPLCNILHAGIRNLAMSTDVIEKRISEAGEREVFHLRKYLRVLALIASLATLLGLLGTITGMISAFQTVATSGDALGRTELLARGIYEAMITTAAGLIVAIPAMIAHHYLSAKIDHLVFELDRIAVEFVESVALVTPTVATNDTATKSMPAADAASGDSVAIPNRVAAMAAT